MFEIQKSWGSGQVSLRDNIEMIQNEHSRWSGKYLVGFEFGAIEDILGSAGRR